MLADRMMMCMNKRKIDHSEPVTVVNSAYTTSASARPQRLSNGWIVVGANDVGTPRFYLYVSKDNGNSWQQLCYAAISFLYWSIASYGNMVYLTGGYNSEIRFWKFDATIQENVGLPLVGIPMPDNNLNALGGVSMAVNQSNGHISIALSAKNSTYANSYNIRSAKSVDGGTTWTKQDGSAGVDQVTVANVSGAVGMTNPCVVYSALENPIIFEKYQNNAGWYYIEARRYISGDWVLSGVYALKTYAQANPDAVVSPDGTIHVAWQSSDSTHNTQIAYSKSLDGGVTWSTKVYLTSEQYGQQIASITADKNNNVYVLFAGRYAESSSYDQLRKIKCINGVWSTVENLTANTSQAIQYPSTCSNYVDFTDPLAIYKDNQAGAVKFRGVWNE